MLLKKSEILEIEEKIGYKFKNKQLLTQAFIRTAYLNENDLDIPSNEVLEFYGDRALEMVVVKQLAKRKGNIKWDRLDGCALPDYGMYVSCLTEERLTEVKRSIVEKKNLAYVMGQLGLQKFLFRCTSDKENLKTETDSVKEDLLEAVFGAIAIDCNWNESILESVITRVLNIERALEEERVSSEIINDLSEKYPQEKFDIKISNRSENAHGNMIQNGLQKLIWYPYRTNVLLRIIDKQHKVISCYLGQGYDYEAAVSNAIEKALFLYASQEMGDVLNKNIPNNEMGIIQELLQKRFLDNVDLNVFIGGYNSNGDPYWDSELNVLPFGKAKIKCAQSKKEAKRIVAHCAIDNLKRIVNGELLLSNCYNVTLHHSKKGQMQILAIYHFNGQDEMEILIGAKGKERVILNEEFVSQIIENNDIKALLNEYLFYQEAITSKTDEDKKIEEKVRLLNNTRVWSAEFGKGVIIKTECSKILSNMNVILHVKYNDFPKENHQCSVHYVYETMAIEKEEHRRILCEIAVEGYDKNFFDVGGNYDFDNENFPGVTSSIIVDMTEEYLEDKEESAIAEGAFSNVDGRIHAILTYEDDVKIEEQKNLENFYDRLSSMMEFENSKIMQEPYLQVDYSDKYGWADAMDKRRNHLLAKEKLHRLERIKSEPYIGRMKLNYTSEGEIEDVFIGREELTDGKDQLICSWFSDIGSHFYHDNHKSSFNIKGQKVLLKQKRNINIQGNKVASVFESFNDERQGADKVIADEYLIDLIKKKRLQKRATDIVATIQAKQYNFIAQDEHKHFVMQGCAGCGKTMVLFHRLKYLIGNKKLTEGKACILTPHNRFNEFIKPIMIDLNLKNINMFSIVEYYKALLSDYVKPVNENGYGWIDLFVETKKSKELGVLPLVIEEDDLLPKEVVDYYYSKEFYDHILSLDKVNIKPINKSLFKREKDKDNDITTEKTVNRKEKVLKIDENGRIDIFNALLGVKERQLIPNYNRELGVVHKCELYAMCMFYYRRCGVNKYIKANNKEKVTKKPLEFIFDYIMIDEAQDLNIHEYKLLKEINKFARFNLYGDIGQTLNFNGLDNWSELRNIFEDISLDTYNINYRNSTPIIDYVNKVCGKTMESIGYEGEPVCSTAILGLANDFKHDDSKRKVIICSKQEKEKLCLETPECMDNVFTPKEVKGMEFDSAYVYTKGMSDKEKYVALTRALEKLNIIID